MNITVNKQIINEIYSDRLYEELDIYLNDIIDNELEKDNIDTDLIDECINALDELRNGNMMQAVGIRLSEKEILKYCKKQTKNNSAQKKALVAGLVVMMLSAGAFLNSNTALANQAREIFGSIISALNDIADRSSVSKSDISSLYGSFPENYSFIISDKNDICLDEITVIAVYQDNSTKKIPIADCTIDFTENSDDEIIVVIGYDGCAFSVAYTIVR